MKLVRRVGLGLSLLVMVGLLCGLSYAGWYWDGQEPDELAGWVEASATALAFLAALSAAVYAARAFRIEDRRQQAHEQALVRSQAELIAAWPMPLNVATLYDRENQRDIPEAIVAANAGLRNASSLPVYDVEVTFALVLLDENGERKGSSRIGGERVAVLPPTAEPSAVNCSDLFGEPMFFGEPEEAERTELLVAVTFKDAGGRRWERSDRGVLSQLE